MFLLGKKCFESVSYGCARENEALYIRIARTPRFQIRFHFLKRLATVIVVVSQCKIKERHSDSYGNVLCGINRCWCELIDPQYPVMKQRL